MKKYAIIVAGGKGERMKSNLPKQFLPLLGEPVLMHTIRAFAQALEDITIVLVLPHLQIEYWKELCDKHHFGIEHKVVQGGDSRFQSVKSGLSAVSTNEISIVGVHDGVRPLISPKAIRELYCAAEQSGAVVPVVDMVDSVRKVVGQKSVAVDRSIYKIVQTPQLFRSDILLESYSREESPLFTDDASVVESAGYEISVAQGEYENRKITTPLDLTLAEMVMKNNKMS